MAEEVTFGRDSSCTIRLGGDDVGISRLAGRIRVEAGAWCVTNLSRKRSLHAVSAQGLAIPLPAARAGWPPSRHVIDQSQLTIWIPGKTSTHAMILGVTGAAVTMDSASIPEHPASTWTPALRLTDDRRAMVVALARGYLRPHPGYDPRPSTYEDVAVLLGVAPADVSRAVDDIRGLLAAAGAEGFVEGQDVRRLLCEWFIAQRLIGPDDLNWLKTVISPDSASAILAPIPGLSTSQFSRTPEVRVAHATRLAAVAILPVLRLRLITAYGEKWLDSINAGRRKRGERKLESLDDDRLCLGLLANDPATIAWAPQEVRDAARKLKLLANKAAHSRLTPDDVTIARSHADLLQCWAFSLNNNPN